MNPVFALLVAASFWMGPTSEPLRTPPPARPAGPTVASPATDLPYQDPRILRRHLWLKHGNAEVLDGPYVA